jgi:hypothetical protein
MDGLSENLIGPEHYRQRARVARELGEKATSDVGKLWLEVAERFEAMAEELERRRAS